MERALERLGSWFSSLRQRRPFNWPLKRKLRWGVGLLVALLVYPVGGTLALWTGLVERLLASEDLRLELENPSYTIWPGRIHMKRVRILVNGETQFSLEGDDLVINLRLLEMIKRRVHVVELAAHGVRYQMRVQMKDTKGMEERVAAYPPLKDLPGAKVVAEKKAEQTEEREADWTVHVEGLDIAVRELWFFEYRYLGDGRLRGGFKVGPQLMEVTTSVQELGPGDLRFGAERVIARNVRGQITADIPEVNPEEHADTSFFELVTARVNLQAEIETLSHVSAYLDGIEVSRGAGPFATDLHLDKGRLGTKSRLDFETPSLRVKGNGFGVETDWKVEFDAAGERAAAADAPKRGEPEKKDEPTQPTAAKKKPAGDAAGAEKQQAGGAAQVAGEPRPLLKLSSKATYASLAKGNREFTVQIHEHREEAALDTIQLSGSTKLKRAALRMPNIVSVDLKDLDELFAEGTPLDFQAGEARATLSLDMGEDYWVRGPVHALLDGMRLNAAGVQVSARTTFKAQVRMNPKLKTNMLEGAALSVRNLDMHVGDETVDGWWLDLSSKRLAFWNTEPPRAEGTVSIRARSLEPALEALAEKDVISDLIPFFTRLDDFRAKATLRKVGPITDVVLESESDVWDASGRVYQNGKRQRMALVVGGQAVSLGVASDGEHLELMPFAKTGWLNEQLRAFPKPIVQLPAAKP